MTLVLRWTKPAVLAAVLAASVACGGADADAPAADSRAGSPAPVCEAAGSGPPAVAADAPPATAADQERFQQLRLETLRLMIDAARLELPIGPCQQRIDHASWTAARGDVRGAADRMETVAAGLRAAVEAARP